MAYSWQQNHIRPNPRIDKNGLIYIIISSYFAIHLKQISQTCMIVNIEATTINQNKRNKNEGTKINSF